MLHPTQSIADRVAADLLNIGGVISSCVRAVPVAPKTPTQMRSDIPATSADLILEEAAARRQLEDAPAPFPHAVCGSSAADITYYLKRLTDLLGPGHDPQLDAKVGALRFRTESWDRVGLIVAVAIPAQDRGSKSLIRGLRRVRMKLERMRHA